MTYPVILFYKYVEISDAELFAGRQRALCESLGLKGRIICRNTSTGYGT